MGISSTTSCTVWWDCEASVYDVTEPIGAQIFFQRSQYCNPRVLFIVQPVSGVTAKSIKPICCLYTPIHRGMCCCNHCGNPRTVREWWDLWDVVCLIGRSSLARSRWAYGYGHIQCSDFSSTIHRFKSTPLTKSLYKGEKGREGMTIGIPLVPVACRVVFWNLSAYEKSGGD